MSAPYSNGFLTILSPSWAVWPRALMAGRWCPRQRAAENGVTFRLRVGGAPEKFQSTPPVWRATLFISALHNVGMVSIHAPRVEGDKPLVCAKRCADLFQSTPPVWRATATSGQVGVPAPRCCGNSISFLRCEQIFAKFINNIWLLRCNLPANLPQNSCSLRVRNNGVSDNVIKLKE